MYSVAGLGLVSMGLAFHGEKRKRKDRPKNHKI
ncbi:hypothetical protein A5875_003473 [Enterococcus sp. 3H8_DIV0648]|nr:hypothetical protein A5875_003473 [Enterococcus sp. 3H8_DIV0648]